MFFFSLHSFYPIQFYPLLSFASSVFLKRKLIHANFPSDALLLNSVAKLSLNDGKSTVERYSPPFVRKGVQASIEDPFTTASYGSTQVTPTGPKSKGRAINSENWRSGSSSGSSAGQSSPSPSRYLVSKRGKDVYLKKYESENDLVDFFEKISLSATSSAEAAQSLYPPACCVFVAK